jgi:glycogen synthase
MPPAERYMPRRVLMTADAVGGVWTYAMELARALGPFGVQVTLAVLGPPPSPEQRAEVTPLPHVSLHECPGRLEWMDDPWDDVAAAGEWLLALERRVAPDVIHLNGYCHGALPWSAPVLIAGHSCVRSWWRSVRKTEAPPSVDRYTAEVTRGLRAADLVVAPSGAMLCSLQRDYGPLTQTTVISNGRSEPVSPATGKEPVLLTAGRLWDEAKNVRAVYDIAGRVPWRVCVAGDEGGSTGQDAVCRLGRLPAEVLERWMQRAAIYVRPARYEPFGLSALEAAHAGCALVLGDIDSLREIWGGAALYVPPDDRHALLDAVQRLISEADLRERMAVRARTRAATFTPRKMVSEYADAYAWLREQRGRRAAAAPRARTLHTTPAASHGFSSVASTRP